jgi:uncharacterized protein YbcI
MPRPELILVQSQTPGHGVAGESAAPTNEQALAEICKSVIHIHKRSWGKGPVKARAHLSQDVLTVTLAGALTRAEQTLRDRGHADEVIRLRHAMQRSSECDLRIAVESILNRSVHSFMSASDPANDVQAEIFVLQPLAG